MVFNPLLRVLALSFFVSISFSQDVSVKLDLSANFNLKAASTGLDDTFANFDGFGRAYPVEYLPSTGTFNYSGVQFNLPPFHDPTAFDVVAASSQVLSVPQGNYQAFHALMTWAGNGARAVDVTFNFEDGSSDVASLIIGSWWDTNPYDGAIHTPFHYANATMDSNMTISYNATSIQYSNSRVLNDKQLVSLTLPPADPGLPARVFAITLVPASSLSTAKSLRVENVRSTTKWVSSGTSESGERVQQMEVTIGNAASLSAGVDSWLTSPVSVYLSSGSLKTVVPGTINRIRSNDQVVVSVGVSSNGGVAAGSNALVNVMVKDAHGNMMPLMNGDVEWMVTAGIPQWEANDQSLATHEAPEWYDDAKFGIFIHYGLYSVPAWAPTGQQYAEWYDWQVHNPPNNSSPTWVHHLATYGPNITYDDFFVNWTASAWNPDDWTDLFADSGAKYFVLVTKHHDGVALFDTNSTDRTSVKLGPKRNFLKELFASAKSRHPELHRGTYFSLPEWFSPAYQPYGQSSWPGGPARNAFTGKCCDPYLGYKPVQDFLQDIQKPQMESLFYEYDTEILWCDIGGASVFPKIGADWYNYAASQGRQVVMNNRCGANQSDFVTPEYATFSSTLSQKWESSAGMDPRSYGFNSDTPLDKYQNASSIITELIDIVSKGGNFLIDIGPKQDGTVIPQMTGPLRQVGGWLKTAGESIYGTRPWWYQTQDVTMTNVRFTTTEDAFYILAISSPSGGLKVTAPVPLAPSDTVTLLGGSGTPLKWSIDNGVLTVDVSDQELNMVTLPAWAFKISYATS